MLLPLTLDNYGLVFSVRAYNMLKIQLLCMLSSQLCGRDWEYKWQIVPT